MAYVPPHLRKKEVSPPKSALEATSLRAFSTNQGAREDHELLQSPRAQRPLDDLDLHSTKEIYCYFWKDAEKNYDTRHSTTLHSTAADPHALGYVLLFDGANPKWAGKDIIFVKSNLDLLPAIKQVDNSPEAALETQADEPRTVDTQKLEGEPVEHAPFAVFEQSYKGRQKARSFKFIGCYRVARLELLQPYSDGLVKMLSKKWQIVDKLGHVRHRKRGAGSWEESMQHKWAVIEMTTDDEAMQARGTPQIEKLNDELHENEHKGKSVNELLQEMRLEKPAGTVNGRVDAIGKENEDRVQEESLSLDEKEEPKD